MNAFGKLVLQKSVRENLNSENNCLFHPFLGLKVFPTFAGNNMPVRELFMGISQFTAMF